MPNATFENKLCQEKLFKKFTVNNVGTPRFFAYQHNIGHIRRSAESQVEETDWLVSQKVNECTRGCSEIGTAEESRNQETKTDGSDAKTYKQSRNDERV
jgi:hypothetical protein